MQKLIASLTMTGTELQVPVIDLYGLQRRRHAVRVRVHRAGEWVDITHRVAAGTIRESNDQPVATLELRLLDGGHVVPVAKTTASLTTMGVPYDVPVIDLFGLGRRDEPGFPSLAPRRKDSPLNNVGGQYMPLLDRYNEILVEAAISVDGGEPDEWVPVFGGYLGDEIRTEHGDQRVYIYVTVRDYAKRLQDDYIEHPITYRNMYASEIIQALLDERFGTNEIELLVGGVDDFFVEEVTFEFIDTWQALQSFVEQSNKDIRYKLDESTGQIRLTYWTPDLSMTPAWAIEEKDIYHETLDTSDASLRHRVIVRWIDEHGHRQETVAEDLSAKKPKEPIRTALIEERQTNAIRDQTSADNLALAVLSALKTVPATDRLILPFTPYMQLYDVLQVTNRDVRSESDLYAVEEMRLHFSARDWNMEVIASDSVKIRHNVWLEKEAKQGVNEPPRSRLLPPEDVQATPVVDNGDLLIKVAWTPRTGVSLYEVRWRPLGETAYDRDQTEENEYIISGLPGGGNTLYPGADVYPGNDVFPLPAAYEIGVFSVSAFGRSSPVVTTTASL